MEVLVKKIGAIIRVKGNLLDGFAEIENGRMGKRVGI